MKNTHLEHFEDLILTGDLSVLSFFEKDYQISLKIDGSPSIIFGTEPATGKFVVGTKSIFNKVKKKICYTQEDIVLHYIHQPKVAEILSACLKYLPRIDYLCQADFLGFGGSISVQPNAIRYEFSEVVDQKIIIAPHTIWRTDDELMNAYVIGTAPFFLNTEVVKFVQPSIDFLRIQMPNFNLGKIKFLTNKESAEAKKKINTLIREDKELSWWALGDIFGCMKLASMYLTMMEIKEDLMSMMIITDSPVAYLNDERIIGEGFVCTGNEINFKLVDRTSFSRANFLMQKNWR